MFNKIKEFFTGKPAEVVAEAPYKIETKSWEDTSDIALAQRPTPEELKVVAEMADAIHDTGKPVVPAAKKTVAKKAPAKKAPAARKPRAPKAPKVAK